MFIVCNYVELDCIILKTVSILAKLCVYMINDDLKKKHKVEILHYCQCEQKQNFVKVELIAKLLYWIILDSAAVPNEVAGEMPVEGHLTEKHVMLTMCGSLFFVSLGKQLALRLVLQNCDSYYLVSVQCCLHTVQLYNKVLFHREP